LFGQCALLVFRRGQKNQREAPGFALMAADFHKTQLVAVKIERGVDVGSPGPSCADNALAFPMILDVRNDRPISARQWRQDKSG
jgi:hypothetical protein